MDRREYLITVGALSTATIAGCSSETDSENGGDDTNSNSENGDDDTNSNSENGSDDTSEQEQPPETRWYHSETKIGILEGVGAEIDSIGSMYIRGTAENFSDTDYDYVQLTFSVYDEADRKITDGLANTSGLRSGQQWRFEVLAPNADGADSYQPTDVTTY